MAELVPRRILHVGESFGGGMFEVMRTLTNGLARRGHEVAIAYGVRPETPPPAKLREIFDPRVELIATAWTSRTAGAQVRALAQLRRLDRRWKPDVVHLHSSFAGVAGVVWPRHTPTVYTPHAYSFTRRSDPAAVRWGYRLLEGAVAARVDAVGACSASEGEQAGALALARRVIVVPNGIPELDDPVVATEPPAHRVVAIGRPLPQRQPEQVAEILGALRGDADVRWLGGGNSNSHGMQALGRAGIPVSGWLPREEILETLAGSSVYLHWTAWDGLPLSVLEALALDVVVVASDIGANRELLGPRQVCRHPYHAMGLIRRILRDPDYRRELLEEQRRRRGGYSAEVMITAWQEVYEDLIATRARAGRA